MREEEPDEMGGRFMEDEVLFQTQWKDVVLDHLVVHVFRKAGRMGEDQAFQGFQLDLFRLDLLLPIGRSILFHASLEVRLSRASLATLFSLCVLVSPTFLFSLGVPWNW